jgi:RimJ/RimL family protein N-acetyltransferase
MSGRVPSLGWQTELALARFDGSVARSGDALVVRTPANPTYWWGNYLLFDRPPVEGEADAWMARFEAQVHGPQPASRHVAFGIDHAGAVTLPNDFRARGFTLASMTVLTRSLDDGGPPPAGTACEARIEPLALPRDGPAIVDQQVAVDGHRYGIDGYRVFAERQVARWSAMAAAGRGGWFGAWVDDDGGATLASSCGVFRCEVDGAAGPVGRFQYVSTHPAYRRRGLCRAVVAHACRHAHGVLGLRTLVMIADPDDVAIGIYESLGFRRGVRTWQLERAPRE